MSGLTFPLGGDVLQTWSWWIKQSLGQIGFINIEQTVSSDHDLEQQIITDVAGYGQQLGRMMDVLSALVAHSKAAGFTEDEKEAVAGFNELAKAIADKKEQHASSTEEMLRRVIIAAKSKRDSAESKRLIERMREALAELDANKSGEMALSA